MPELTEHDYHKLAEFCGGKEHHDQVGPTVWYRGWLFPDKTFVRYSFWRPDQRGNENQADRVLRALVKKASDIVMLGLWNERPNGAWCKPDEETDRYYGNWWPEAVCLAALDVIEKGGK